MPPTKCRTDGTDPYWVIVIIAFVSNTVFIRTFRSIHYLSSVVYKIKKLKKLSIQSHITGLVVYGIHALYHYKISQMDI